MDAIDMIRDRAAEANAPIEEWLNGIPVVVYPDGMVTRRKTVPAYEVDDEGILREKAK